MFRFWFAMFRCFRWCPKAGLQLVPAKWDAMLQIGCPGCCGCCCCCFVEDSCECFLILSVFDKSFYMFLYIASKWDLSWADPSRDPSRSLNLQLATAWVCGTSIKATGFFFNLYVEAQRQWWNQSIKVHESSLKHERFLKDHENVERCRMSGWNTNCCHLQGKVSEPTSLRYFPWLKTSRSQD